MIRTVADLLSALKERESASLASWSRDVNHPTLIGDMYEGLTRDLLDKAIFDDLDLRVVDGKIRNANGELSGQIDCMIVHGDGEPIPYTASWIYPVAQVIAVVEVKKNLYSEQLLDAHENLLTVRYVEETLKSNYKYIRSCFWRLTCEDIPGDDIKALTPERQMLFGSLARDICTPLRIVIGYVGFKGESNLQKSIIEFLQQKQGQQGFGPSSLPSLIICDGYSVVKVNGSPYTARLPRTSKLGQEEYWPLYASTSHNSILILLEILWTRLRYRFAISATIFGEDQDIENLNLFLLAKPVPWSRWELYFDEWSEAELKARPEFLEWQPPLIGVAEFTAFARLSHGEELNLNDAELPDFLRRNGLTIEQFAERLKATGLIDIDASGAIIPLAESLALGVTPKGEYFVDSADNPRSLNWALRRSRAGTVPD